MIFNEYKQIIEGVPYANGIKYEPTIMWMHSERLPLGVISLEKETCGIIRIPCLAVNIYGKEVPVVAIGEKAFAYNNKVTDIVLPSSIQWISPGAFAGCSAMQRITIPKSIKSIGEGTFKDCRNLEDIYYEGTVEEWQKISIVHQKHEIQLGKLIPGTPVHTISSECLVHIPGNDALFTANIHFNSIFNDLSINSGYKLFAGGKEITNLFKAM